MNRVVYLLITVMVFIASCKSSTEPDVQDGGVYLPASTGSRWVYIGSVGDTILREAFPSTIINGNEYRILRDSLPTQSFDTAGNRINTFLYDTSYIRSDSKGIYSIASLHPFEEATELLTAYGSTWQTFDTVVVSPLFVIEDDYYTVTLLPTYTVGDSTYNNVLFILRHETVPTSPGYSATDLEIYYAEGIGQIAVRDVNTDKFALQLVRYSIE